MSIVKSFSVGNGDMFYIKHGSSNFTIIDCCMSDDNKNNIIDEIKLESKGKDVVRFISTHPDDDHIRHLIELDDEMNLLNFYCVANKVTKLNKTTDFDRYCELRDNTEKVFHIFEGCSRKWMNNNSEKRGSSGINILWPITTNEHYIEALRQANDGGCPNNISPIVKYSLEDGSVFLWMGDLEEDFMDDVKDEIILPSVDILFAPHHGRDSGKVPQKWLDEMTPKIIIIGEAPSENLDYYEGFDTITQKSAEDITFKCVTGKTHIYASNYSYSVDFLDYEDMSNTHGKYLGTLNL